MEKVRSGIAYLDKLIDRFNIGDNVIWQVESGAFVELFCRAFIRESVKDDKDVIYVAFNNSPKNIVAKIGPAINNPHVVFIDCFTSGKGGNSTIFLDLYKTTYPTYKCRVIHTKKPADVAGFIDIINEIEEKKPRGTRYVFDSLTGMQDLWGGSEHLIKFFTRQCPRLYELDTIAYWILAKNAHSDEFRAQISHITQVVIDLSIESRVSALSIIKAENHPESRLLKSHPYEVVDSSIEFLNDAEAGVVNLGRKIREVRLAREISQAQLASGIGVTPSTISQAESNAITLSLPALLRLTRALNVSMGELFGEEDDAEPAPFLSRAKNRTARHSGVKGVTIHSVLSGEPRDGTEAYLITVAPDVETGAHLIFHKGREVGFMLCGSLELEMKDRAYTMNEGDAVHFSSDVPSRWKNNSEKPAKLLLVITR